MQVCMMMKRREDYLEHRDTTELAMGESWGMGLGELEDAPSFSLSADDFLRWKRDLIEFWWILMKFSHIPVFAPLSSISVSILITANNNWLYARWINRKQMNLSENQLTEEFRWGKQKFIEAQTLLWYKRILVHLLCICISSMFFPFLFLCSPGYFLSLAVIYLAVVMGTNLVEPNPNPKPNPKNCNFQSCGRLCLYSESKC